MDLKELKSAWALFQEEVINNDKVDQCKIVNSVHSKSKSEISKIKSGLFIKLIIASLAILVALVLAVTSSNNTSLNPLDFIFSPVESALFFSVLALSISVMAYFNYRAYSHINIIQHTSLNLKDNLANFIEAMNKAIVFNIYSDAFMTPVIFAWVYYAYAMKDHEFGFTVRTVLLFILPILIGLLSYFFQKLMQRLRFGQYLDRLNSYLSSLQQNSS